MLLLVRYFPEIILKTKPVRQQMSRHLERAVRARLQPIDPEVRVRREWDRLSIQTGGTPEGDAAVIDELQRISGIAHFQEVVEGSAATLDSITEAATAQWGGLLAGRTFAVRCKRSGQHPFTSQEVERQVGAALLRCSESSRVDLGAPDLLLRMEVRDDTLYLVRRRFPGIGGYPQGSQEAVVSLISGGYDSSVASYLSLRRGLTTHFVFFNLGGREHEAGVRQVVHYLWRRYAAERSVQFVSVSFEAVVAEILRQVHHSQMGVVLKRAMLRTACQLAERLGAEALVTGESVAQVASQTLTNLRVIDAAADRLVLRPLATSHKSEIIQIAQHIGTAEFAAAIPEYCGVISVRPTTRARTERIAAEEARMDPAVLERAVADAVAMPVSDILENLPGDTGHAAIEVLSAPVPDAEIIDIRHPAEAAARPLRVANTTVRSIPFYELEHHTEQLDRERIYLLYCEQGSMSRLHAGHMAEEGFRRVKVYQP